MRRELGAWVGLLLALGWFAWLGPRASEEVRQLRAEASRSLSTSEVRMALRRTGTRPDDDLRALLDEAGEAEALEADWNLRVAAVLDEEQRQKAMALEPGVPPVPPHKSVHFVEPELPALAEALMRKHGMGQAEIPLLPPADPWPGADRRRRARGLLALLAADELSDEQAHAILQITLDAMLVQSQRARIERSLGAALPSAVRASILEERFDRGPGI